jgi:hypothetical protein
MNVDHVSEVKDYIVADKWAQALEVLGQSAQEQRILYCCSLLCRLMDSYDEELRIIDRALSEFRGWGYMEARKRWHELPLFERLEPRPPFEMNLRRVERRPSDDLLKRFCFVTSANSRYASLLIECLESLEASGFYKGAPVFVIDCGLTASEKDFLMRRFSQIGAIVEPECVVSKRVLTTANRNVQAVLARGHFRELFPGYRYYFWIDADAWLQDETGIDDFLHLAVNQGIAVPEHPYRVKVAPHHHWLHRDTLTEAQKGAVIGARAIIAAVFCVDAESDMYDEFTETVKKNIELLGPNWGMDQEVLLYLSARHTWKILPVEYAYEGVPLRDPAGGNPYALYTTDGMPVKAYHLGGGRGSTRKWNYFLNPEPLPERPSYSHPWLSIHYRVWPWREKAGLKAELLETI